MKNVIFGGLIQFEDQEKLMDFMKNIDYKTSMKIIEGAIEYGQKNGLYNLDESYCLYNCLNVVKDCINNYGSGFKGPSQFPDVELDQEIKNENINSDYVPGNRKESE